MKTLTETLINHKSTNSYAMAVNIPGYIPEVGETVEGGGQTLKTVNISINCEGSVAIEFENGQKISGAQLAKMQAEGIVKIK